MSVQYIPLYKPHFYIVKLGFAGVCLFFLFLLQNIDCGYRRGGSNVYPQSVLSKNKKNIKTFLLKIFIFYNFKNHCILHGQVFVMYVTRSSRFDRKHHHLMKVHFVHENENQKRHTNHSFISCRTYCTNSL